MQHPGDDDQIPDTAIWKFEMLPNQRFLRSNPGGFTSHMKTGKSPVVNIGHVPASLPPATILDRLIRRSGGAFFSQISPSRL